MSPPAISSNVNVAAAMPSLLHSAGDDTQKSTENEAACAEDAPSARVAIAAMVPNMRFRLFPLPADRPADLDRRSRQREQDTDQLRNRRNVLSRLRLTNSAACEIRPDDEQQARKSQTRSERRPASVRMQPCASCRDRPSGRFRSALFRW